jgi:hypothetical protein
MEQAVELAEVSIMESLQEDYQQIELACAISDYIVINCEYAYRADGVTPDDEEGGTAYAALINNRAVCAGYTGAFTLLAQQLGLQSIEVSGTGLPSNESHVWNMVKIDGSWYHIDTTWNDPTPDRPGQAGHDYLLVSDGVMANYRNASQQYHADWEPDAPKADDTSYDEAFWLYEDFPISFADMHFEEWVKSISETSFEDIIIAAVESNAEANVARFGYDKETLADGIRKLYPNIGYAYYTNADGIVVAVGDWDLPEE